jgi:hypothetical protein
MIAAKIALALSAALLLFSLSVWTMFLRPAEGTRERADKHDALEAFSAARREALDAYGKCIGDAEAIYSEHWKYACKAKARREIEDCRIDAVCVRGTSSIGAGKCVPRRDYDSKPEPGVVDANCAAEFRDDGDPDCTLGERGAALNAQIQEERAECRTEFDAKMVGYVDAPERARPGARLAAVAP